MIISNICILLAIETLLEKYNLYLIVLLCYDDNKNKTYFSKNRFSELLDWLWSRIIQ